MVLCRLVGIITRVLATASDLMPRYAQIALCAVLTALTGLLTPFIIAHATDRVVEAVGTGEVDITPFVLLAAGLFAAEMAGALISNVGGYLGDTTTQPLRATMSARYFQKLLGLPQRYFDTELTGTLIGRLNRSITEVTQFLQMFANNFLPMLLTLVASVAIAGWYAWPLAIMLVLIYPVYAVLTTVTSSRWQAYEKQKNADIDIASGRFAEAVSQIKVVKAFVQERRELSHLTTRFDATIAVTAAQSRWWHGMDVVRRGGLNVLFFGVYAVVFVWTAQGRFSVGTMVLLLQLVAMTKQPVTGMSYLVDTAQRAIAGSRDYFSVLDEPSETETLPESRGRAVTPVRQPGTPAVEFDAVDFSYDPGQPVLDSVSFEIAPGERVAFVGESGGGKTTIVSLLLRLYRPQSGTVLLSGHDVGTGDVAAIRSQVGVVFQEASLFSGTIRENITYGRPDATDAEVEAAATRAQAHGFITGLKDGYETQIGERGVKLSGGQKQRIAIARAILADPPVLVLDEATSSLDTRSERLVQAGLDELMADRTSLIVAHRLSTIASVDRIVTLKGGRIDEIGPPDELATSGGIYAQLLALQESGSKADRKKLRQFDIAG